MLSFKKIRSHTFMIIEFCGTKSRILSVFLHSAKENCPISHERFLLAINSILNSVENSSKLIYYVDFPLQIKFFSIHLKIRQQSRENSKCFVKWFFISHCKSGVFSVDLRIRQLRENQKFFTNCFFSLQIKSMIFSKNIPRKFHLEIE